MKVLLINPPVRQSQTPQDIPVGLAMIASVTKEAGHKVAFLDLNANRIPL